MFCCADFFPGSEEDKGVKRNSGLSPYPGQRRHHATGDNSLGMAEYDESQSNCSGAGAYVIQC